MRESGYRPDPRSTDELVRAALEQYNDNDEYELLLERLQYRGTREVFDIAVGLAKSDDCCERVLGAGILAEVGSRHCLFVRDSVDALIPLLNDRNDEVITTAALALGRRATASCKDAGYAVKAVKPLLALATYSSAGVRQAVAYALGSVQWWQLEPEVYDALVETIINLASDEDVDVRLEAVEAMLALEEWHDDIIDALLRATRDKSAEVRASAFLALSTREYPGVADMLIDELSTSECICDYALWAAADTKDPRLLPILLELKAGGISSQYIDMAVKACSTG